MLLGAGWVIFLSLDKNSEISPNHGGIRDLSDLRENSTSIPKRDGNLLVSSNMKRCILEFKSRQTMMLIKNIDFVDTVSWKNLWKIIVSSESFLRIFHPLNLSEKLCPPITSHH